ncbi:hypothetical protein [Oscillatoria acuminata]|uniref:Uncharacterized protein n=1 Tax=Oscillatoria acuminata PCC 6304 TaxID=56110 RepID=K9TCS3_9CYAN|nr:hypothetical protein [Oscillatoria acuminata]AFY79779.1 hypothetical protein Oscil6304_0019 [Oscillatoria acuminata PCC 6304]
MIIKDKKGGVRTSALALGLFALLLPACQQENRALDETEYQTPTTTEYQTPTTTAPAPGREPVTMTPDQPMTTMPGQQMAATTENISSNPENFIGQTVTVRGDVQEIDTSSDTFLMDDDRFLTGEGILVINSSGEVFAIPNADEMQVQVTGEVRQFNLVDINTGYGLNLDPQLYSEYENQPAIVAESLALSPTPEQVSENPDLFYNRPIAIEGQFNEQLAPNAFTFNNDEVLVINADELQILPENEDLVVTGEVRPFDLAALQSEYNLNWDAELQQRMQDQYSNSLVLVADGIYPTLE